MRRLYALVSMLPYESATATLFRVDEPEPQETRGPSSWSDLAAALTSSKQQHEKQKQKPKPKPKPKETVKGR